MSVSSGKEPYLKYFQAPYDGQDNIGDHIAEFEGGDWYVTGKGRLALLQSKVRPDPEVMDIYFFAGGPRVQVAGGTKFAVPKGSVVSKSIGATRYSVINIPGAYAVEHNGAMYTFFGHAGVEQGGARRALFRSNNWEVQRGERFCYVDMESTFAEDEKELEEVRSFVATAPSYSAPGLVSAAERLKAFIKPSRLASFRKTMFDKRDEEVAVLDEEYSFDVDKQFEQQYDEKRATIEQKAQREVELVEREEESASPSKQVKVVSQKVVIVEGLITKVDSPSREDETDELKRQTLDRLRREEEDFKSKFDEVNEDGTVKFGLPIEKPAGVTEVVNEFKNKWAKMEDPGKFVMKPSVVTRVDKEG